MSVVWKQPRKNIQLVASHEKQHHIKKYQIDRKASDIDVFDISETDVKLKYHGIPVMIFSLILVQFSHF